MINYNPEKDKCVAVYRELQQGVSSDCIARRYGLSRAADVSDYAKRGEDRLRRYEQYKTTGDLSAIRGLDKVPMGFERFDVKDTGPKRKRYSDSFCIDLWRSYCEQGKSHSELITEYSIPRASIKRLLARGLNLCVD